MILGSSQLEKPRRINKLSETGIGFRVYLGRQYRDSGHILPLVCELQSKLLEGGYVGVIWGTIISTLLLHALSAQKTTTLLLGSPVTL